MMRSGDGIESSYVSVESEIGFLWKVGCREKINRQSGAAETGKQSQTCCFYGGRKSHTQRSHVKLITCFSTPYTSTDID